MRVNIELLITLLNEFNDDYVGLWSVIREIEEFEKNAESVKQKVLGLILYLLKNKFIIAGVPSRDGRFVRWEGDAMDIIHTIKSEWDKLGHKPDIGDIVWFTSTKAGEEELKRLQKIAETKREVNLLINNSVDPT